MTRPVRIEFEGALLTVSDPDCPEQYFDYDESGRLLGEYTTTGQARQEHIWVDDTPVAMVNQIKDEVFYVHSDHLNTPRALTAKEGILRWRWAFQGNAFGELAADSDPMSTGEPVEYKLRFPGQYFDAESGLHYNYFRDYEPGTGRYIESDPIGLWGGVSTFSYAEGNPFRYADPLGLRACDGDCNPDLPNLLKSCSKQCADPGKCMDCCRAKHRWACRRGTLSESCARSTKVGNVFVEAHAVATMTLTRKK